MVDVHHASHSVKPEAVKLVLFHPEPEVAHEEAENFVVAIVEETAVPELVTALCTLMEVLVVAAVKLV